MALTPGYDTALPLDVNDVPKATFRDWMAAVEARTVREVLGANRTYYVRTDGNDSNTGLADSAGGAFLTLQKAITACYGLDIGAFNVTVQVRDGTFSAPVIAHGPFLGSGSVSVVGNTANPQNVIVNPSGEAFWVRAGAQITLSGMELRSTAASALYATDGGKIILGSAIRFGAASFAHAFAEYGGTIFSRNANSIVGNAAYHMLARSNGTIDTSGLTCTIAAARAFTSFARADFGGVLLAYLNTYTGAGVAGTTGERFRVETNGLAYTLGGGPNYFPGNAAGVQNTGGQYV